MSITILSLQELIRKKRIEELKKMAGTVHLEINIPRSRHRDRIEKLGFIKLF